jgi:Protein of unknown function (DUF1579)
MSSPELLETLAGRWQGSSMLVLPSLAPPGSLSPSTATIEPAARGTFARIDYTWSYGGAPHEGVLLVGQAKRLGALQVVWIDSWHQSETFLLSAGAVDSSGALEVLGHYPAPTGPDWGWRTVIRATATGWELVMHNISPDGEEALAFHNVYQRA